MLEWARIFGTVGTVQLLVQGIGFLSGILIVRTLSLQQYALYTLANTLIVTMSMLGDAGISNGLLSEGGKVWRDHQLLGRVIATGLELRRRFASWLLGISAPVLLYLLRSHGASWIEAFCLLALVCASFWFSLLGGIYSVGLGLHQRLADTQRVALIQNSARLAGLVPLIRAFPNALISVAASLGPQAWATSRLRRLCGTVVDLHQPEDAGVRAEVLRVVKRMLPNLIYLSISGQITIWLISFCGSTANLAQLGALTRLGQAFVLVSSLASAVLIPRFARLQGNPRLVLVRFCQVLTVLGVSMAVVVLLVARFPTQVLLILGNDYNGLVHEVALYMLSSVLYVIAGIAAGLSNARGAVLNPVIGVLLQLGCQVLGVLLFGVTSIHGILLLAILVAVAQILMHTGNFVGQILARQRTSAVVG